MSLSASDVDYYFIIRILLDSVFNMSSIYSYAGGKLKHNFTGFLFRKVAYTKYDVPWFVG
jgi:hypothetical protein